MRTLKHARESQLYGGAGIGCAAAGLADTKTTREVIVVACMLCMLFSKTVFLGMSMQKIYYSKSHSAGGQNDRFAAKRAPKSGK